MFYYLNGTVAMKEPQLVVLDCQGVGYACKTTSHTLSSLEQGAKETLWIHTYVREDVLELYGFRTKEERSLFERLISVSGVGPRAALSILSANTPTRLAMAILNGDEGALTCAPGVGKKLAQRIILELKDRLAKGERWGEPGGGYGGDTSVWMPEDRRSEACAALSVLGYGTKEIQQAMEHIDVEQLTLEETIKQALRWMLQTAKGLSKG